MVTLELTSSRRELLTALLGGAVAAGCSRRTPTVGWDGGFIADYAQRGHRLRDALKAPVPAPEAQAAVSDAVIVVGAGIAGLSAAWALRRAGRDVRVLELGDEPGGTSTSGRSEVTAYPWGAHYVPAPGADNPDLVELLQELGAVERDATGKAEFAEHMLCADPKERVFYQGVWQPGLVSRLGQSPDEVQQWRRFEQEIADWVAFRDKEGRRAFTLPMALGSEAPEVRALDAMSFAQWMKQRGFDAPRLRWYAAYACKDDFGTLPEDTSAYYGLHYFCARVQRPHGPSAEFLTWPQGNGRIVEHLVSRIGAERVLTGQVVSAVQPEAGRVRVHTIDAKTGQAHQQVAPRVIFALPSYLRKYLIKGASDYQPSYAPWMVANVHLARRPGYRGFETAWDNVIYDSRSLGYVVADHQTKLATGPTVWTWYLPLTGADPGQERQALRKLSYKDAADSVVADLTPCHNGLQDALRRIDLRRWGHGMVRPEVGMRFSAARAAAASPWQGVHFAHTDLSGMALIEEAVFHGLRAAREVLSA